MLDKISIRAESIKNFLENTSFDKDMFKSLRYVKSGSMGHTFRGNFSKNGKTIKCAFKVVPFDKKDHYGSPNNESRPENAELNMLNILSKLVLNKNFYTPHLILPIKTFNTNIQNFIIKDINNKNYKNFLKMYKNDMLYNTVSVLVSEWADNGDLLMFLKKNYAKLSLMSWKTLFFQLISTLATIHLKYPDFRHNDLKCNNILISSYKKYDKNYFLYVINGNIYKIPYIGYMIGIWDFDFSCIPKIVNNSKVNARWTKKINVNPEKNQYYDIHYFFNTLIKKGFLPEILKSNCVPKEVKTFIYDVVPKKLQENNKHLSEKGRILINTEIVTPLQLIEENDFFKEFRIKK